MIVCRTRDQKGWMKLFTAAAVLFSVTAALSARAEIEPLKLSFAPDDESVYAPPQPPREDQGTNQGGVNVDLSFNYMSDYVYRGINHSDFPGRTRTANLQFDGKVSFNTGRLPHPFFGVFTNLYDNDPVSRFQEIRPFAGFEWSLRPITVAVGVNSYIYPEREHFNTSEAWMQLTLDDSLLFRTERPLFTPYVYGAYDYDKNDGFYLEAGVSHDLVFEDWGLAFKFFADVAYMSHIKQQFIFVSERSTGFQHYDVGMVVTYQLNSLLHVSRRYGEIDLKGYLTYTDGITRQLLHSDSTVWGGAGIQFKY
jgi:hypothetical protein